MEDYEYHGWGMGWGWILGLIILALLVWFIIRSINKGRLKTSSDELSALDILKESYAKGEITEEEFEIRKRGLK